MRPRDYRRFAVTREIDDGLLAPSTRGFTMSGKMVTDFAPFGVSEGRDTDHR